IAPDLAHVKAAHAVGARGVELYTGALVDLPAAERGEALAKLGDAARLAAKLRLGVGLGGRLDEPSLGDILEAAPIAAPVRPGPAERSSWASIAPRGTSARRSPRRGPSDVLGDAWPLVTAAEMRALDRFTIETLGVPGDLLMELAGAAVAREAERLRTGDAPV